MTENTSLQASSRFIIPDFRFYITLFHSDSILHGEIIQKFRNEVTDQDKLANAKYDIQHLADFPYRHYHKLAVLRISIGEVDTSTEYKPSNVFEMSQKLKSALLELSNSVDTILFDTINLHPYVLVISSGITEKINVMWPPEMIQENKKNLGGWIEYYSGQWNDYSDELFDERIRNNLSNRLSELHYIRSNSAFIYMERHDVRWQQWMNYMEEIFISQIMLSRSILYSLMILNQELDDVSERIRNMPSDSIKKLEEEVKFVEDLQLLASEITSNLSKEKLMNRLHHSTKVINECFRVFSIDDAHQLIDQKIGKLHEMLQKAHETAQTKLQNQQKRWILILNGLIGYQVIFTIAEQITNQFSIDENGRPYKIFIGILWSVVGLILSVSLGGLVKTYLKSKGKGEQ
ncbi:MAG: hypothetical protein HeimC2_00720 [Candidatus Heimdallarchaeota archaeon LC_2]|nr:MAG: hypothetical protein HeimC2_00720 [Candidatus Heimdallarchaeota archaeon LC_2]